MHADSSSTGVTPRYRTGGNSVRRAANATLCRRWRDRYDIGAARELVKRHQRLLLELTEVYRASGLLWDDLIGEGQVGLMRSICRFDPDQGVEFSTYAAWWIKVTLQAYVLKHSRRSYGRSRDGDQRRALRAISMLAA